MAIRNNRLGVNIDSHIVANGIDAVSKTLNEIDYALSGQALVQPAKADTKRKTDDLKEFVKTSLDSLDIGTVGEALYGERIDGMESDVLDMIGTISESSLKELDGMAKSVANRLNGRSTVNNVLNSLRTAKDTYSYVVIAGLTLTSSVRSGDVLETNRLLDSIEDPSIATTLRNFTIVAAAIEGNPEVLVNQLERSDSRVETVSDVVVEHLLSKLSADTNDTGNGEYVVRALRILSAKDPTWTNRYALGTTNPYTISHKARKLLSEALIQIERDLIEERPIAPDGILDLLAVNAIIHTIDTDPTRKI